MAENRYNVDDILREVKEKRAPFMGSYCGSQ